MSKIVVGGSPKRGENGKFHEDWFGYLRFLHYCALEAGVEYMVEWGDTYYFIPTTYSYESRAHVPVLVAIEQAQGNVEERFAWSEDPDAPLRRAARAFSAVLNANRTAIDATTKALAGLPR